MILALDIATKTGFAVGEPGSAPYFGTIEVQGRLGYRCYALAQRVGALVEEFGPDLIVFEQPIHAIPRAGNSKTLRMMLGLCTAVEMVAARNRVKVLETPMQTWRKHFIGYSKAPRGVPDSRHWIKKAVMDRCRQLKWDVKTDDQADACGVWDHACSLRSKSHQLHTAPGLLSNG